ACFGLAALIAAIMLANAFAQEALAPPQVTASSVYVLNADTGQPLYRKNEDKRYWILSITKLITAYVLVQRMGGQLSDTVTITQSDLASGSTAGPRKGDVSTLQDLLYGMLLVSGKDAAIAIADARCCPRKRRRKALSSASCRRCGPPPRRSTRNMRNLPTLTASLRRMSRRRETWL